MPRFLMPAEHDDESQPGELDLDPSLSPYVVAVKGAVSEQRFLFDPSSGIKGFAVGKDHLCVYRLSPENVDALARMGFVERLAYVQNIDLDGLTMVEEHGTPRQPFDPYQMALFND